MKRQEKDQQQPKSAAKKFKFSQDDDDEQFDKKNKKAASTSAANGMNGSSASGTKGIEKQQDVKETVAKKPKKSSLGKQEEDSEKVKLKKQKEAAAERKRQEEIEEEHVETVKRMEKEVHASKEKLNNVAHLLTYLQSPYDRVIFSAIHSLCRIFTPYLESGRFRGISDGAAEKEAKVLSWLSDKYQTYVTGLINLLNHKEPGLQLPAMKLFFNLLLSDTTGLSKAEKQYTFANELYFKMLNVWISCENFSTAAVTSFVDDYVNKYNDIRHYTLKNFGKMSQSVSAANLERFTTRVLDILQKIEMPEEDEPIDTFLTGTTTPFGIASFDEDNRKRDHKPATQEAIKHIASTQSGLRRVFGDCWVSFLKLSLPIEAFKRVLVIMYRSIIPYMSHPTHLMDFLTDSYNQGGVVSILALNALFILITKHNLDYPDFYPKLYALLEKSVTHVKYRARFFRMLELFLQSPLLPSYLVAAFMKRLCRLLLFAPPAGCMAILPLIYNLLLRHPSCAPLIHRVTEKKPEVLALDVEGEALRDPFNFDEKDPHKSNAMASSLWELVVVKQHYCPLVAKFVRAFEEVFRMQPFQLDKYLENTYETLLRTEMRVMKEPPALKDDMPKSLFPKESCFSTWDFTPYE